LGYSVYSLSGLYCL